MQFEPQVGIQCFKDISKVITLHNETELTA